MVQHEYVFDETVSGRFTGAVRRNHLNGVETIFPGLRMLIRRTKEGSHTRVGTNDGYVSGRYSRLGVTTTTKKKEKVYYSTR